MHVGGIHGEHDPAMGDDSGLTGEITEPADHRFHMGVLGLPLLQLFAFVQTGTEEQHTDIAARREMADNSFRLLQRIYLTLVRGKRTHWGSVQPEKSNSGKRSWRLALPSGKRPMKST